jgi:cytochrome P450
MMISLYYQQYLETKLSQRSIKYDNYFCTGQNIRCLDEVNIDATRYYYHKGRTPGTPYTLPFVNILAMLIFPVRYWAELGTIAMDNRDHGICTSMMADHFMLFVTDPALCRQVMTAEGTFQIYAHPNALWLFGPKNLIYMPTLEHKAFRAILTPALFSADALQQYAQAQEQVAQQFLSRVAATAGTINARLFFRTLAAASSQEAFLGPYLTDSLRQELERDILTFTLGFLSFPCPWFRVLRRAMLAKDRIEQAIMQMVLPSALIHALLL